MFSTLGFGCSEPVVAPECICTAGAGVGRGGQIAVWLEEEYGSNVCSTLYLSLRKWYLCGLKNTMEMIMRLNFSPPQLPLGIMAKLYVLSCSRTPLVFLPPGVPIWRQLPQNAAPVPCKDDSRCLTVILHIDPMSLSQDETTVGQIKCPPASCADRRIVPCQATMSVTQCVSPFFSIGPRVSRKCPEILARGWTVFLWTHELSSFVLNPHRYFMGKLSIRD